MTDTTDTKGGKIAPISRVWVKLLPPEQRMGALYPKDGTLAGQRLRALALCIRLKFFNHAFGENEERLAWKAIWATLDDDRGLILDGNTYRSAQSIIDGLLTHWDYCYGEDLDDVLFAFPTGGDEAAIRGWAARARDAMLAATDKGVP